MTKQILEVQPVSFGEACEFVNQFHRHHKAPRGYKFAIALNDGSKIVGVCIVGRPVARFLDDTWTLEVTRLCTDGTKNACSKLYSAAWRAVQALGYKRLVTYILDEENGASLKAANWRFVGKAGGGTWNRRNRHRVDIHPVGQKQLWEAV